MEFWLAGTWLELWHGIRPRPCFSIQSTKEIAHVIGWEHKVLVAMIYNFTFTEGPLPMRPYVAAVLDWLSFQLVSSLSTYRYRLKNTFGCTRVPPEFVCLLNCLFPCMLSSARPNLLYASSLLPRAQWTFVSKNLGHSAIRAVPLGIDGLGNGKIRHGWSDVVDDTHVVQHYNKGHSRDNNNNNNNIGGRWWALSCWRSLSFLLVVSSSDTVIYCIDD